MYPSDRFEHKAVLHKATAAVGGFRTGAPVALEATAITGGLAKTLYRRRAKAQAASRAAKLVKLVSIAEQQGIAVSPNIRAALAGMLTLARTGALLAGASR